MKPGYGTRSYHHLQALLLATAHAWEQTAGGIQGRRARREKLAAVMEHSVAARQAARNVTESARAQSYFLARRYGKLVNSGCFSVNFLVGNVSLPHLALYVSCVKKCILHLV